MSSLLFGYSYYIVGRDMQELGAGLQVVQEEKESYTVSQMAEFLFGAHTPSNAFAVLQMLNKDRLFFKQMGRQPATFQPRPQKEVDQIRKQVAAEQRVSIVLFPFRRSRFWGRNMLWGFAVFEPTAGAVHCESASLHLFDVKK